MVKITPTDNGPYAQNGSLTLDQNPKTRSTPSA
jgi:hypothetical protein